MWQSCESLKLGLDHMVHAELVARIMRSNPLAIFFLIYKNNLTQFYST